MLAELRIRDLLLIADLSLSFSPGFNVLTGETGAGKSLIAQAVSLLLGRRAEGELVRRGAETAEVEGLFVVADEPAVRERLLAAGLPASDELLVRRVIPADGRQRCFLNGRLASLPLLAELARDLASFAGQHEHLALLEPSRQRDILDDFGRLAADREEMARLHAAAVEASGRLSDLREREKDRAQRLDWLLFRLREIEALAPAPDELDTLAREIERLRHLGFLLLTARRAVDELYERDGAVFERLGALARDLRRAVEHDGTFGGPAGTVEEAAALIAEVARGLRDYGAGEETAPERLDELAGRRAALEALVRKHGMPLPEILASKEGLATEAAELARFPEALSEAEATLARALSASRHRAEALTEARRRAGGKLAKAVTAELRDLAMPGAAFRVDLRAEAREPGPLGFDVVEFSVALNPGEGAHPLRTTASGGELSRLMLALRRALAGVGPVGTHVFDEVDAGIGGAQAALVGRKLREVSSHHQVLCITHLPQIAGLADEHFLVAKLVGDGRTATTVRRLTADERVEEIARMLGGETLTDRTRAAARELLRR
ncbi:MAG: DNA repair protein RecN [Planctomycetes bacterium]|jgi:DNA repair protein RecN (Recombination protein N)|nr:DNA repair protein RecN [Planctomycetota bacterium]